MMQDTVSSGTYLETDMGHPQHHMRWKYRLLSEPSLSNTLSEMANAKSYADGRVDSVTIQPYMRDSSQDRLVVSEWDFGHGKWIFSAVFDGD